MRIISGSARGIKLITPEGLKTRPTADRIKESLFNMIALEIPNANFLDLFSGSGAVGIEALSRGARHSTFIDNNKNAISSITQNLKKSKLEKNATIINNDILNALKKLSDINNNKFDIIFLDPPYNQGLTEPVLNLIAQSRLLSNDGFIICEQHLKEPELKIDNLKTYKVKEYKITKMLFMNYL